MSRILLAGAIVIGIASVGRTAEVPRWPGVAVVVIERRVDAQTTSYGAELKALRRSVVDMLTGGADPLVEGDHVFLLTDGLEVDEHQRLLREEPLTTALQANAHFAKHLRLPPATRESPNRVKLAGVDLVHEIYDGNRDHLACVLAREITAPLTLGWTGSPDCPTEGPVQDRTQTRSFSRPELTFATQLAAALGAVPSDTPIGRVQWLMMRSSGRRYIETDLHDRVMSDFGTSWPPVLDYVSQARDWYGLVELPAAIPHGNGGSGIVQRYDVNAGGAKQRIDANSRDGMLEPRIGDATTLSLLKDAMITVPQVGAWSPPLDSFVVRLPRMIAGGGRIDHARIRFHDTSVDGRGGDLAGRLVAAATDDVLTTDAELSEQLTSLVQRLRAEVVPKDVSYEIALDVLVSPPTEGASALARSWRAVPVPMTLRRFIRIAPRPLNRWDGVLVGLALLLGALVVRRIMLVTLRPARLAVGITANGETEVDTLACVHPAETPTTFELVAGCPSRLRRLGRTKGELRVSWSCLSSRQLALKEGFDSPLALAIDGEHVPMGDDDVAIVPIAVRLGTVAHMRSLGTTFSLQPRADAIDLTSIPRGDRFQCVLQLRIAVVPFRRWFPCAPARVRLTVPVELVMNEQAPAPGLRVGVDEIYRRLGFDLAPTSPPASFATVEIINDPSATAQDRVARSIRVSTAVSLAEPRDDVAVRLQLTEVPPDSRSDGGIVLANRQSARYRIELIPNPSAAHGKAKSDVVSGNVSVTWESDVGERGTLQRRFEVTWLLTEAMPLGIDFGTSATRMAMPVARHSVNLTEIRYDLNVLQATDEEPPSEFPAVVTIAPEGNVARVGYGPDGVDGDGNNRLVVSAKAALLSALTGRRSELRAAQADVESFLRAVCRSAAAEIRDRAGAVKAVVTVPGNYGPETMKWYRRAVETALGNAAIVVLLREAEAVAYFYLLAPRFAWGEAAFPLPREREYRLLVVDQGAGTTDLALVGIRNGESGIESVRTIEISQSSFGGDRYDEAMLESLFGFSDAREQLRDTRHLREEARRFKCDKLPQVLAGRVSGVTHATFGRANPTHFGSDMEGYFKDAFDHPMQQLAAKLDEKKEDRTVDLVLGAGRGILAPGCRQHIADAARRVFTCAPESSREIPMEQLPLEQLPWAVARGAVQFASDGAMLLGASDRRSTRQVLLVADAGTGASTQPSVQVMVDRGDVLDDPVDELVEFNFDVQHAWLVAPADAVDDAGSRRRLMERLLRDGVDQRSDRLLAGLRPPNATRRLRVRVDNDEAGTLQAADTTATSRE